jgi:hypothetical protein
MQTYKDLGGDSGVTGFEIGQDSITVQFHDGSIYLYTNASAGSGPIQTMKQLAARGEGLNAYINTTVKKDYASRLR